MACRRGGVGRGRTRSHVRKGVRTCFRRVTRLLVQIRRFAPIYSEYVGVFYVFQKRSKKDHVTYRHINRFIWCESANLRI